MVNCNLHTFDTFETLSYLYNPGQRFLGHPSKAHSRLQIRSSCHITPPPPPPPLPASSTVERVWSDCTPIQHCIVDGGGMGEFARFFCESVRPLFSRIVESSP